MKKDHPGYPLPSGVLGADELVCQLVYLPDRDEYWQALLAAIHFMSTWIAWEPDDDHRAKDAAANWREAFEFTIGCWRMTCLEEITDRMDIMIDLLGTQVACCDSTTIGPVITVITNITPGVGDDPEFWGETAVADWAEWLEYVCYHAHRYVDSLIESAKVLDLAVTLGNYTIELLSLMQQTLWYILKGTPVGTGMMMEIYQNFREGVDLVGEFDGLADKFEAAREDIVCSIVQGGSLSDAVEDAIDNNIIWLLFYVFTDYGGVQAVLYEGTVDETEYLPPVKRYDCDLCDYEKLTPSTVTIHEDNVTSLDWDDVNKRWTGVSDLRTGCEAFDISFWTDGTKTVPLECRIRVLSDDGWAGTCGGRYHHLGYLYPVTEWEFDLPRLPDVTDAPVDRWSTFHTWIVTHQTVVFELYAA